MDADYKPELGPAQAGLGPNWELTYSRMATKITGGELERAIDKVLDRIAANVGVLIDGDASLPPKNRVNRLAAKIPLGKTTLRRLLAGSKGLQGEKRSSPQIDTLIRLAWYYKVSYLTLFDPTDTESIVIGGRRPGAQDDSKSAEGR